MISLVQILRLSFLLLACIFIILPRLCSGKRTVRETFYSRWNVLFAVPRFCDIHIDSAHALLSQAVFQQVFKHQCSVLLLRKQCYFKTVLMDYLLLVNFGAVRLGFSEFASFPVAPNCIALYEQLQESIVQTHLFFQ